MPGCGYVCPACNDLGFDEQGKKCFWCSPPETVNDTEEWIKNVHEGPCCSDIGQEQQED